MNFQNIDFWPSFDKVMRNVFTHLKNKKNQTKIPRIDKVAFVAEFPRLERYQNIMEIRNAFFPLKNINKDDFDQEKYNDSYFFMICSLTYDDIHKALKYGKWTSSSKNNKKLNDKFLNAKKQHKYVILFFKIIQNSDLLGVAFITKHFQPTKKDDVSWKETNLKGTFEIEWVFVKTVQVQHIILSKKILLMNQLDGCEELTKVEGNFILKQFHLAPSNLELSIFNQFKLCDYREDLLLSMTEYQILQKNFNNQKSYLKNTIKNNSKNEEETHFFKSLEISDCKEQSQMARGIGEEKKSEGNNKTKKFHNFLNSQEDFVLKIFFKNMSDYCLKQSKLSQKKNTTKKYPLTHFREAQMPYQLRKCEYVKKFQFNFNIIIINQNQQMDLKNAIENDVHHDVINEIDKFLQIDPLPQQSEKLIYNKLVALIRMNQYDRAQEVLRINNEVFQRLPQYQFLNNYILYQKGQFKEILVNTKNIPEGNQKFQLSLLKAQTLAKKEKYLESFLIYQELRNHESIHEFEMEEELNINLIYVAVLLILTEGEQIQNFSHFQVVKDVIKEQLTNRKTAQIRESFLNYILLLIVLDQTKVIKNEEIMGTDFDYITESSNLINSIQKSIEEEGGNDSKGLDFLNFTGTKFTDYLTLFILKTFFMKKKQQINWNEQEISSLGDLLLKNPEKIQNQQLRISLLSYLILLNTSSTEQLNDKNLLLVRLDQEIDILKKSQKNLHYLEKMLLLNKAVLLLHLEKYNESNKLLKTTLKNEIQLRHLPLQMTIFIYGKQYKGFQDRLNEFEQKIQKQPHNQQLKCIYYLFQISFYYHINNQKQYAHCFIEFIEKFFMKQLTINESERFLKPAAFNQLAQNLVFYIQRNQLILNALEDKILNFVEYIRDPQSVAKIAEGFINKQNYETAQKIYSILVQRTPENILFQSRLNFLYSIISPEKINEEVLPEFELVTDFNTLNNLENDYLKYISTQNQKPNDVKEKQDGQDKQKVKKIKKKMRIKWPKNFDFENPGPRPDPERWLPKNQRTKNRKKGKKIIGMTRTQGGNVQAEKTVEMYTQQNSTALQKTTKDKRKKKGGRRR